MPDPLILLTLPPNDEPPELGDGRGCEPVIYTLSERGVWLPPRPLEGGTPVSFVGAGGRVDCDCDEEEGRVDVEVEGEGFEG